MNDESPSPPPLPIQFQLLYNWDASVEHDALLKNKIRMFPTFKCDWHGTPIYRLIDHDLDKHYISAGQLWKSCGLTLTEGLFLFKLSLSEYQIDFLLPHFPFCDIWVSLTKARHMASVLSVESELGNLLTEDLDEAFSSDNMSRNELVHNWKVESIPNVMYSTRALLETSAESIELLGNRKIRTQISRVRQPGMVCKDRLENGLVRWAVAAYEAFHNEGEEGEEEEEKPMANAMWDVMQGLLYDLQTLALSGAPTSSRVLSDSMVVGNMPLKREYLHQGRRLQDVYMASMAEKLHNETQALALLSASLGRNIKSSNSSTNNSEYHSPIPQQAPPSGVDPQMMLHDRMDSLEQEIYRMKRKYKRRTEDMESEFQELQQQILALEAWKIRNERSRKSERIWILMISLSLAIGLWAIGATTKY